MRVQEDKDLEMDIIELIKDYISLFLCLKPARKSC